MRDWMRGKLGLFLMGGAMLSKSLIQFSVDGWGCVPSLLFTWGQTMTSLVAQTVKCLPAMQETWVWSLGREDPLEKEMAIHSSTLAWKSHGQRSLIGYSPWGRKESDTTEWLHFTSLNLLDKLIQLHAGYIKILDSFCKCLGKDVFDFMV